MSDEPGAELIAVLEELADVIRQARPVPMSASVLVNRAQALSLVEQARTLLPQELTQAHAAIQGAGKTLDQAKAQAEQIRADARREAENLLADQDVVKAADDRADVITTAARAKADTLMRNADEYCDRVLAELEVQLGRSLREVAGGRKVLADKLQRHDSPEEGD